MNTNDFLSFRKMITPVVIQIIFWIGVASWVLFGIGLMIAGAGAQAQAGQYGGGGAGLVIGGLTGLLGLSAIIFGPIQVRIACEVAIIFFRIHETLTEIRNDGRGVVPAQAYTPAPSAYLPPQSA